MGAPRRASWFARGGARLAPRRAQASSWVLARAGRKFNEVEGVAGEGAARAKARATPSPGGCCTAWLTATAGRRRPRRAGFAGEWSGGAEGRRPTIPRIGLSAPERFGARPRRPRAEAFAGRWNGARDARPYGRASRAPTILSASAFS